jgi:F0F1-type ATP synthase beta subunit
MSDVLTTFSHMNHPIGGDERNAPTPQKLAKEAADLAAQVLFFVDQCGGLEVS